MRWPTRSLEERFWSHVDASGECWLWTGATNSVQHGLYPYGLFSLAVDGRWRMIRAHRFAYELANGPVPPGLVVAHSCDNPKCVRPDHLFVATQRQNLADMTAKGRRRNRFSGQTACKHGHEFTPENTTFVPQRGYTVRRCRECARRRARRYYHEAARTAVSHAVRGV